VSVRRTERRDQIGPEDTRPTTRELGAISLLPVPPAPPAA